MTSYADTNHAPVSPKKKKKGKDTKHESTSYTTYPLIRVEIPFGSWTVRREGCSVRPPALGVVIVAIRLEHGPFCVLEPVGSRLERLERHAACCRRFFGHAEAAFDPDCKDLEIRFPSNYD